MKRVVLSILAAGFLMTTVCNGASVMTMTTSSDNVKIRLAGSGTVTIDWGDGSEIITSTLKEYKSRWWHKREFSFKYANASSRTITITGESITHLGCNGNKNSGLDVSSLDVTNNPALTFLECLSCQFTSLDVSNNPALRYLEIRFCNQLTSLDVSKNTKLSRLICQGTGLTSLDVSNNKALTGLDCSMNHNLKNLDVSNNPALTRLSCAMTPLNDDTDALNNLFRTLNSNAGKKIILVGRHLGKEVNCDESIANLNGWTIENVKIKKSRKDGRIRTFVPDIV